MKFLLDQGLPRSAGELLRRREIDAVHAAECGLSTASDVEVLKQAEAEDRTVVTLDADFHALLMIRRALAPSVLRIRIEGLKAGDVVALIERVAEIAGAELQAGALVTVTSSAVRIHRLR